MGCLHRNRRHLLLRRRFKHGSLRRIQRLYTALQMPRSTSASPAQSRTLRALCRRRKCCGSSHFFMDRRFWRSLAHEGVRVFHHVHAWPFRRNRRRVGARRRILPLREKSVLCLIVKQGHPTLLHFRTIRGRCVRQKRRAVIHARPAPCGKMIFRGQGRLVSFILSFVVAGVVTIEIAQIQHSLINGHRRVRMGRVLIVNTTA